MTVRELIEVLSAGDLDAEVYLATNREATLARPVEAAEDVLVVRRGRPAPLAGRTACVLTRCGPHYRVVYPEPPDGLPLAAWGYGRHTIEAADVLPAAPAANAQGPMPNAQGARP